MLSTAPGAVAGAPFRDEDAAGSEDQLDQGIPPGKDHSDTLDRGIESGDLHRSGAAKNLEELNSFTARTVVMACSPHRVNRPEPPAGKASTVVPSTVALTAPIKAQPDRNA
ncbi:hypothetical protein [Streptomyces olivaceoviridis]|uniref:hypothetical protein n=1 Tax=Streptomyces olivaceoviridis TaxID=1921 RepID=UPI0037B3410D